jgi:hypothetical protein
MRSWKEHLSPIFLAALLAFVPAPHASATTYTLSGATYNPASLFGVYIGTTGVTGSFTTASPLPANLTNAPIAGSGGAGLVTSWAFNDGVFTYTNANSDLWQDGVAAAQSFSVSTDSAGKITTFFIVLTMPINGAVLGQPTEFLFLGFSGPGTSGAVRGTCIALAPDGSCQGYRTTTDEAESAVPGNATFAGTCKLNAKGQCRKPSSKKKP